MLRATVLLLAGALLGCSGGSGGGGTDAATADGVVGGDGGADAHGGGGLTFNFTTAPALPQVSSTVTVSEIRFGLRDLRAIGDAATGDLRTSIASWPLRWQEGHDPDPLAFPQAPRGIYSGLEARLSSGEALEIRGQVRLAGGQTVSFRVESDELSGAISVPLEGLTVDATARSATILLSVAFLGEIDWNALAHDGDDIEIQDESPQMAAIFAGIRGGFSLGEVR